MFDEPEDMTHQKALLESMQRIEINLEHNNVVIRTAMNFELKLDYETGDSDKDSFSAE